MNAMSMWRSATAPANTPADIVEKLYGEFKAIVAMMDVRSNMLRLGVIPLDSPPRRTGGKTGAIVEP